MTNKTVTMSRELLAECAELLSIHDSGGGSREGFAVEDLREILARPEVDMPLETGHAIPQWLRDQFDAIELEVRKMGAEGVFTQMRTKVQAYFEMMRSVERGKAGRDMHIIAQQKNLITSLRADLQEAIAIDCDDDAIDACAEVERTGTPGSVIREMNDELVDLRKLNFELRGAARCEHLHHCKSEQHDFNEPCKVLDRIDAAMNNEATT